jgi:hypothetical protein
MAGALIYLSAFWMRDAVSCLAAPSGCQVRGDATAMLIVLAGFLVVTALFFAGYFYVMRRVTERVANRQVLSRSLMLVTALVYSLAVGLVILEVLGNRNAFWINAIVGGVVFSIWCALWAFHRSPQKVGP